MSQIHVNIKSCVFCILLLLCSGASRAQQNMYKVFNSSNGLLSDDNYMTYQDRDRFIWILSEKGVLKYDGSDFKSFTVANGLPLNDIWYIKEDQSGRKWIGGFFDGLFYIKDDVITEIPSGSAINSLLFTSETKDTLFFTSLDERKSYYMVRNLEKLEAVPLAVDEGLKIRLDDKTLTNKKTEINKCSVYYHSDGTYFTTDGQITRGDVILNMNKHFIPFTLNNEVKWIIRQGAKHKVIDPKKFFGAPFISQNSLQPSEELIVQLEDDLLVYKDLSNGIRDPEMENRLHQFRSSHISWTTLDHENNLWLSIDRSNIVLVPKGVEYVDQYRLKANEQMNYVNLIIHKDKLVFHQPIGSLFSYNLVNKELTKIFDVEDRRTDGVIDLRKTQDGYYFLSSTSIYFQPNVGSLIEYPLLNDLKRHDSRQFIPIGNKAFLTSNFSILQVKNDVLHVKNPSPNRFRSNSLSQSVDDWIMATPQELIFSNKRTRETTIVAIPGIQCVYPIGDYVLLGTNGYGMMLVNRSGEVLSQLHEGKSINEILLYQNHIVSASNKGISIDRMGANHQLYPHSVIGVEHGLSSNNISGLVLREDELIAMHYSGFDLINLPEILKEPTRLPTVIFDSVMVNGERYIRNAKTFEWNQNNFVFHFSGISYWSLGNVTYKYRLLGVEESWIHTNESTIRFPNMAPGIYTFEVVAMTPTNLESSRTLYQFSIDQHFTQTWWFYGLIFFLLASSIGILVYRLLRRKTRKLEIEKQMANLEMNALQSQMNPHFVFNSLNSIQSVLFLKGERETNRYIAAFSTLIRQTLDNSKKGMITIQEEIDYLTTYLNLESYRLDDELQYSIEVDDALELDEGNIPCMLVQPMVENAILHGLTPKRSDRKLIIRFVRFDELLKIEIEDNGIGRENAERDVSRKDHKSWGSTILQERLTVLEKMNFRKITYNIIDLSDGTDPCGTLIQIQLPISYGD